MTTRRQRIRSRATPVVAALLALVAAGCSSASADLDANATRSQPPRIGVYQPGAPDSYTSLRQFTAKSGVKPQLIAYYSGWGEGFASAFASGGIKHQATTLVQLDPTDVSPASITAGASDHYLESYAKTVKNFRHPVLISFGHEMNGTWYAWASGHSSPGDFIAAWRHIVQIFRNEGASNAKFVWVTTSLDESAKSLEAWWPGFAWVNFVGIDGYYYGPGDTYRSVFGTMLKKIRTFTNMRVIFTEVGIGPNSSRLTQIAKLYPAATADHVYGIIWFDETQHAGYYHQDWRLEDDPAALTAFEKAVSRCCHR